DHHDDDPFGADHDDEHRGGDHDDEHWGADHDDEHRGGDHDDVQCGADHDDEQRGAEHDQHHLRTVGPLAQVHDDCRHDELRRGWLLESRVRAVLGRDRLRHCLLGADRRPWFRLSVLRRRQSKPKRGPLSARYHPAGATSYLDLGCPGQLVASNGTGKLDCTKGSGPASECVNAGTCTSGPNPGAVCFANNAADCSSGCTGAGTPAACCAGVGRGSCACLGPNPHKPCTSDTDCGGASSSGACQPVENCFFGPPLAIPHPAVGSVSTCVINVIATDASGTSDPATGAASVDIPLNSRVYLTGN